MEESNGWELNVWQGASCELEVEEILKLSASNDLFREAGKWRTYLSQKILRYFQAR